MLKVAFDPVYIHPLPEGHRFPMEKYDLLPRQLLHEGTITEDQLFSPAEIDLKIAAGVHQPDYLERLYNLRLTQREQRESGFPHSEALIQRESVIMEGTRKCAEYALQFGAAMNIAGGTHHAFSSKAEGFCLMNDQAIAARWLISEEKVNRVLIIDLDVHQGNGTAEIFGEEPNVFTFSMHGRNNYPMRKEHSDLDVELEDGIRDKDYLVTLEQSLDRILSDFHPEFVFYQCGVDILETDKLGKLAVSMDGIKKRDELVFQTVRQLGVPVVCSMGGGYSADTRQIVEAHAICYRKIQDILF
jgi:acetoin utilization deacetylase AcuC-like enzyme